MKKHIANLTWLILFCLTTYYAYVYANGMIANLQDKRTFIELLIIAFLAGISASSLIHRMIISKTSNSLNMYKRELEKESIGSTESSARIKVLESKIQVLEKALQDALNK